MNVIDERTKCVRIPQNSSSASRGKDKMFVANCGLKQNFFDPTKSSPPNDFMIKLHMRMNSVYDFKNTTTTTA
jgi:hypothetical protein